MLNIAVPGCGRIGRMHARNIARHPRAALASVLLASDHVDAILIATSTSTHADLLERAVAAGKPVPCEKPIDLSLARVDQCAEVIRGTQVPIMLGFVRRLELG